VVEEHKIHTEWYQVPDETAEKIARAKRDGQRVVAIGTTTVRTLEYAAGGRAPAAGAASEGKEIEGAPPKPQLLGWGSSSQPALQLTGEADIFIYPGYRFRVVDAMLTNFHLPKSTLLMLVSAFAGRERILAAYEHAVRDGYRFFSYGDCMFLE
jgi:S-adenosylmethionine:tRNA ribosyltransferase-isomerase